MSTSIYLSSQGASHEASQVNSYDSSHKASHEASHEASCLEIYEDFKYMTKKRWDEMQYM